MEPDERVWLRTGESITLVGRRRGAEHTLWMLRGDSLVLLARHSSSEARDPRIRPHLHHRLSSFTVQDGCAWLASTLSCWNAEGEQILGPLGEGEMEDQEVLGAGWLWDLESNTLHRPGDGASITLGKARPGLGWQRAYQEAVVLLPDGRARYFARGGEVRDLELPQ